MAQLPTGLVSHARKVCNLYKRALRNSEAFCIDKAEIRYEAALMRHRFDQNAKIKDISVAKKLLIEGEKELAENLVYNTKKFAESPGGPAYERHLLTPDWVLDFWDPMEKAQYPKYFALREKRKIEYEKWYYEQYPEAKKDNEHH